MKHYWNKQVAFHNCCTWSSQIIVLVILDIVVFVSYPHMLKLSTKKLLNSLLYTLGLTWNPIHSTFHKTYSFQGLTWRRTCMKEISTKCIVFIVYLMVNINKIYMEIFQPAHAVLINWYFQIIFKILIFLIILHCIKTSLQLILSHSGKINKVIRIKTPKNSLVALIKYYTMHHFCCIYAHTECISSNRDLHLFVN